MSKICGSRHCGKIMPIREIGDAANAYTDAAYIIPEQNYTGPLVSSKGPAGVWRSCGRTANPKED